MTDTGDGSWGTGGVPATRAFVVRVASQAVGANLLAAIVVYLFLSLISPSASTTEESLTLDQSGEAVFEPGTAAQETFSYSSVDVGERRLVGLTRPAPLDHPVGAFVQAPQQTAPPSHSPSPEPDPEPTAEGGGSSYGATSPEASPEQPNRTPSGEEPPTAPPVPSATGASVAADPCAELAGKSCLDVVVDTVQDATGMVGCEGDLCQVTNDPCGAVGMQCVLPSTPCDVTGGDCSDLTKPCQVVGIDCVVQSNPCQIVGMECVLPQDDPCTIWGGDCTDPDGPCAVVGYQCVAPSDPLGWAGGLVEGAVACPEPQCPVLPEPTEIEDYTEGPLSPMDLVGEYPELREQCAAVGGCREQKCMSRYHTQKGVNRAKRVVYTMTLVVSWCWHNGQVYWSQSGYRDWVRHPYDDCCVRIYDRRWSPSNGHVCEGGSCKAASYLHRWCYMVQQYGNPVATVGDWYIGITGKVGGSSAARWGHVGEAERCF